MIGAARGYHHRKFGITYTVTRAPLGANAAVYHVSAAGGLVARAVLRTTRAASSRSSSTARPIAAVGIASALYHLVEANLGRPLRPNRIRSAAARKFWASRMMRSSRKDWQRRRCWWKMSATFIPHAAETLANVNTMTPIRARSRSPNTVSDSIERSSSPASSAVSTGVLPLPSFRRGAFTDSAGLWAMTPPFPRSFKSPWPWL